MWSSLTIEKNDWHGVGRKGGGQLSTNGVKLYSVTSHKFVLGRTNVYMYGGNVEKGGGQLSINGVKLYSVTSHKFVLGRTSVYTHGRNVEKGEDRTW